MATAGSVPQMARLNRAAKLLDREKALEARAAERQGRAEAPAGAVSAYRARVAALTDCHRIPYAPKDWAAVAAKGLVDNPVRSNVNGAAARRALLSYRPTFWDRLFGLDQDRRRLLNARVAQEESKDEAAYRAAYKAAAEHNAEVEFAMKLVALDLRAVRASLAKNTTIGEIGPAIEGYDLTVPARGRLAVTIAGLEQDDMPDERCEIGDDGKGVYQPLSRAAMSALHRANICSAALRVGAELLSAAPVATVEIVVECDIVDRMSGEAKRHPVLQLKLSHRALAETTLARLDAVDGVRDFGGRMDWTSGTGFAPIDLNETGQVAAA